MSPITTHVLDTARGRPAANVPITLDRLKDGQWVRMGAGSTDNDGRLKTLLPSGSAPEKGTWRITFDTATYFQSIGVEGFYPEVSVVFELREPTQHYHVPLLLNPYGFSTYRGS